MQTARLDEFSLIDTFFNQATTMDGVIAGIGDDAAVVTVPPGQQLLIATDTQVADRHFFKETPAYHIGYKLLAVNLSDIYAMGGVPKWYSLALTLPEINEKWLAEFSSGLFACASKHQVQLIGGDTTKGPLTLTLTVQGLQAPEHIVYRRGAAVGDHIIVTGELGLPAIAIAAGYGKVTVPDNILAVAKQALYSPRLYPEFAERLSQFASAAIDVSDGLLQDLQHCLTASGGLGANIELAQVPISEHAHTVFRDETFAQVLAAGDEYALCCTVPDDKLAYCRQVAALSQVPIAVIGQVTESELLCHSQGNPVHLPKMGWQHF